MSSFEKDKLSKLLVFAQGHRTREAFARDAGLSLTYVSNLIRQLTSGPPSPTSLRKLSDASQGRVDYPVLMQACGYYEQGESAPGSVDENAEVQLLSRAGARMSGDNLKKLIEMGRILEPTAFIDAKEKKE